jgi:predicted ATPase
MIESLHIAGFKLFRDLTLPKLGRMNLFVGENNTGKSCLLEAIGIYAGRNPVADILQAASLRSQEPLRPWEVDGWNEEGTAVRHPVFDLFHRERSAEGAKLSPILIEEIGDPNSLHVSFRWHDIVPNEEGLRRYVPVLPGHVTVDHLEFALPVSRGLNQVALITRRQLPLRPRLLDSERIPSEGALVVVHLTANGFSDEKEASLWDSLVQGPGQKQVLNWMRMLDPRIEALDYIAGRLRTRVALLKVEDENRIPLNSMGDGLRRMFHVGLAMATASKGILLIDEFENGLHWRVQRELWAALARAAQEFDVQIFATTHSRDCIGGFVSASKESGIEDAKLYRLEREGDEIYAVDLALINVEDALELNGEVR